MGDNLKTSSEQRTSSVTPRTLEEELRLHYVFWPDAETYNVGGAEFVPFMLEHGLEPVSFVVSDEPEWAEYADRLRSEYPDVPLYVADETRVVSWLSKGYEEYRASVGKPATPKKPLAPLFVHAAFRVPEPRQAEELLACSKRVVICDRLYMRRNISDIMRLAYELGYDAVLFTGKAPQPYYREIVKLSGGASLDIPVATFENWPADFELLERYGYTTVATALRDDALLIDDPILKQAERLAVLFGSEDVGLANEVLERCTHTVIIPMRPGVDSLNVAAAAAIALYELGGVHEPAC